MSVRDFISALSRRPVPMATDTTDLVSICDEIAETYNEKADISPNDLQYLIRRYTQRLTNDDWDGATENEMSILIRAFSGGAQGIPERLQIFLLKESGRTHRLNLLGALWEGYLEGWKSGSGRTCEIAGVLQKQRAHLPELYRTAAKTFPAVLDPIEGDKRLATDLLAKAKPYEALVAAGFSDPHAPRFLSAVSEAFLTDLPAVRTLGDMQRLMGWVRPDNVIGLQGDLLIQAIDLILAPWRLEAAPKAEKAYLLDVLVREFGDPRITGSHIWNRVVPACRGVLLRWLAGDSIVKFMDVISAVEDKNPETWRMRRAFWLQLYDEGLVTEAWVALHPAAQREARARAEVSGDLTLKSVAKQAGSRKDTSLLIMRVGDTIVVEGSQNYRVHIFRPNALQRPELYLEEYKDQDITLEQGNPNTRIHDRPGHWRNWVRERLT